MARYTYGETGCFGQYVTNSMKKNNRIKVFLKNIATAGVIY